MIWVSSDKLLVMLTWRGVRSCRKAKYYCKNCLNTKIVIWVLEKGGKISLGQWLIDVHWTVGLNRRNTPLRARVSQGIGYKTKQVFIHSSYYYYCAKPICMRCTVTQLARESVGFCPLLWFIREGIWVITQ